ncbi:3-hydroxyacyl-CoA dehydrogenase NAD-binding [Paenibacillus curdlanolyticus YK9]|uniref:3-hydroxyacyl-CoA dehydrogenase NAD-binding n=1 Tax=Paenibacillus curdlanolyticus YK9 TaxID=717606 RepID=E0I605_9BACL|nr:3-hydroxybutyryl-CoA dehydrogenase [Paenibacillus curdlanolyticus]EFM12397.1 3-hydroxyacyl-CoA dehydrogenase NAD-binding [Paenibacillus curdlanolyticus YK9]
MTVRAVTVIGAGQMGRGIAQTLLQYGFAVTLYDIHEAAVARGVATIAEAFRRQVGKGRIAEEQKEEWLARLAATTELTAAEDSEIVIEAAPEQLETKLALFQALDRICPSQTILASNTSSISITAIAAVTDRADRVIGMHFMNPVPVMPLVEVIRGLRTSDDTFAKVADLAVQLGKAPVEVRDYPGFVSNRLLMPMINEAIYAVYEGVAEPEAIDQVMKLGMNHPMGPLALADLIGLDTCLAIMETLHEGFGDSKYRPCPLLRQYVQAGWLGRKSGKGFFQYEERR